MIRGARTAVEAEVVLGGKLGCKDALAAGGSSAKDGFSAVDLVSIGSGLFPETTRGARRAEDGADLVLGGALCNNGALLEIGSSSASDGLFAIAPVSVLSGSVTPTTRGEDADFVLEGKLWLGRLTGAHVPREGRLMRDSGMESVPFELMAPMEDRFGTDFTDADPRADIVCRLLGRLVDAFERRSPRDGDMAGGLGGPVDP
jgi:hypothetical protein